MMFKFVFFFFMQKTAYEMRISDWSSDLCSSDLGLFEQEIDDLVLVQRRAELGGGHRLLLDVLDEALAVLGAVLLRGLHDQAAHFLLRHLDAVGLPDLGEIGRASGRERVCQYV